MLAARHGRTLHAHIALEEKASIELNYPASDRLGVEFHILLAELTSNRLLHKYVSEVALRCALIIAVHDHDHSHTEHHAIVDALQAGDTHRAAKLIAKHLHAVEERTLQPSAPSPHLTEIRMALFQWLKRRRLHHRRAQQHR